MIDRLHWIRVIDKLFETHDVVAIIGPRQCGKTTLAREYFTNKKASPNNYFDLENRQHLSTLINPSFVLSKLTGLIVIDEVQRLPELFPSLRVLVDNQTGNKFLILGSASRELLKQTSESLAGRIAYIELGPFDISEVNLFDTLWLRGGFPKSYLATNDENSYTWREEYITTYLEQDIPNLGINIPAQQLYRFWMMLCHYHGNIINYSELGKSLNLSHSTIIKYCEILSGTFMIRLLQPWYENISKRQVKSPKLFIRDSGILHNLLNIPNKQNLIMHPKLGSSWEGFALEQVIRLYGNKRANYFWATHAGAELDLLMIKGMQKIGFEFKYSEVVKVTKSMRIAIDELQLEHLYIITPENRYYQLEEKITLVGLENYKKIMI